MTDHPIEPWKLLSSTYAYRDKWVALRSDTVSLPNGEILSPYHVLEAPEWVNVVAITDAGNIILVEQYRHAVKHLMLELPAGHVEPGEAPEIAIKRELLEETGHESAAWHDLGATFPAASRLSNKVRSYLAIGAHKVAEPRTESSENLRMRSIPWATFIEGMHAGDMMLREANQLASVVLVHMYARSSNDPAIARLRI